MCMGGRQVRARGRLWSRSCGVMYWSWNALGGYGGFVRGQAWGRGGMGVPQVEFNKDGDDSQEKERRRRAVFK